MNIATDEKEGFVPGLIYRFDPPVVANGRPAIGLWSVEAQELAFETGWCIGFDKELQAYMFHGDPIDDRRIIKDELRGCYFYLKPEEISKATVVKK